MKRAKLSRYAKEKRARELLGKGLTNVEIMKELIIGSALLVTIRKKMDFEAQEQQAKLELQTIEEEKKADLVQRYDDVEPKLLNAVAVMDGLEQKVSKLVNKEVDTTIRAWDYVNDALTTKTLDPDKLAYSLLKGK